MKNKYFRFVQKTVLMSFIVLFLLVPAIAQKQRPITIDDYSLWRRISQEQISNNGNWLVYVLAPVDGNGELMIFNLENGRKYIKERGSDAIISNDSKWVAYKILPDENLEEEEKKKMKNGMGLLNLVTGVGIKVDSVSSFTFSEDGKWFAYKLIDSEKKKSEEEKEKKGEDKKEKKLGNTLILKNLESGTEEKMNSVVNYSFDKKSRYFVYSVSAEHEKRDGLYARELFEYRNLITLLQGKGNYEQLSWSDDGKMLAFVSDKNDAVSEIPLFDLYVWDTGEGVLNEAVKSAETNFPDDMVVSQYGILSWTENGRKLFFGIAPKKEKELTKEEKEKLPGVDVWHWKDVILPPRQKIMADQLRKQSYKAVYHVYEKYAVPLGDKEFETVTPSPDGDWALGETQKPYFEDIPWRFPNFSDLYVINTRTNSRKMIREKTLFSGTWSPEGNYLVYYHDRDWWLYSVADANTKNLTEDLDVAFWEVEDDHPDVKRAYGGAYWLKNDEGVLLYDKYDIWMFPVAKKGKPVNITGGEGRKNNAVFRYTRLDREEKFIDGSKPLLLSYFHNKTKASGYYRLKIGNEKPEQLVIMDKIIRISDKAEDSDKYIITIESFKEFPDVHVADTDFADIEKVTNANPHQKEFLWGSTGLVEWRSIDGIPLQGIIYYPANYAPYKKYPTVVYTYERLSDGLHRHYIPIANHRFNPTVYTSNGYAVFMPDVVYRIGYPGQSSLNCIVPGVHKLIEMGIADPEKIALQGHSWGGYETAYIVTQTDIFAAAISGAPVSNMTSAYGGIRWGSGLVRQFQYERTQSRIGGSLWEYPERYIANSPLFFADKMNTPLLILHGDEDGAVPWYQGIELIVALRRMEKPAIMLQYNGEPHHLIKKKNRYDFTKRMWEFYEHYLRGKPAPEWIKEGVPFLEKGTK